MDDARLDACGCCEGMRPLTPASVENPSGLSAIVYRIGTHATFQETMLAKLSRRGELAGLTTRESDDPSIALLDAAATMLDVLTFYQERIANEGYLRTATERCSILELARSIGYELSPGVAASTYLAFTLEDTPLTPRLVPIDKGTKVQSLPGPGEQPQIFETTEDLLARPEWNALQPQLRELRTLAIGDTAAYIQGVTSNLKVGDGLLFVVPGGTGTREFRRVAQVEVDPSVGTTRVSWDGTLQNDAQELHTFRQKAALFGHNAPDWLALSKETKASYLGHAYNPTIPTDQEWPYTAPAADADKKTLKLDSRYPSITAQSWVVVERPAQNFPILATVTAAHEVVATGFTLSSNVTQLTLDRDVSRDTLNDVRQTSLLVQGERLKLAEVPLSASLEVSQGATAKISVGLGPGTLTPLGGDRIVLDRLVDGLQKGQTLIVSGKLIRARVQGDGLELHSADGMTKKGLIRGETLRVLESPRLDGTNIEWHLLDAEGFEGLVKAGQTEVTLAAAAEGDTEVSEVVYLADSPTSEEKARTVLDLARPLAFLYDRATVRIHANVAKATHGESKAEVVGGGDSSEANPAFFLKQEPLTNVSASTPSGRESTLEVRVNDILWEEAPSLYAHGPKEQVYTTRLADDGTVEVRFGDGVMGARLPSGIENVKAAYRVGTGLPGMVKANQLSLLMSRPLGVKSVINPLAPTGAADPEPRDQARRNAPFTVLTLDRVVSLRDYEDFARAFAGIGKAQAVELRHGEIRLVHITIAGANGGKVDVTSELHKNLKDALAAQSDKHQPFILESYNPLHFNLEASLRIHHRYQPEKVLPAARAALLDAFSFEARSFGQPVTRSEVIAVMQAVEGVTSVDLDFLYFTGQPKSLPPDLRLGARTAAWDGTETVSAELLNLNPTGIDLKGVKP